jgi:hypothetical protein
MNYMLNSLPAWVLCFCFSALCVLLSLVLHHFFSRRLQRVRFSSFNESGGIMFGAISLIYSLILAFVIVAVWEDYEEINKSVIEEAAKLEEVREQAADLPLSLRIIIDSGVANYVKTEIANEWYQYQHHHVSNPALRQIRAQLLLLDTLPAADKRVVDAVQDNIADVQELRYTRAGYLRSHIPLLIWVVLVAGSIIVICFSWFFTVEPAWANRLLPGMLTGMLAMCMFLLFMLDHPLCGSSAVSPDPLLHVIGAPKN